MDYGRLSKNELAADVANAIDTLGANNYAQCADIMKFLFDEMPRATAQAVRVEREAIAAWLEGLAEGDVGDVILEHVLAIRSGEHQIST